jgi:hypothetical protein
MRQAMAAIEARHAGGGLIGIKNARRWRSTVPVHQGFGGAQPFQSQQAFSRRSALPAFACLACLAPSSGGAPED